MLDISIEILGFSFEILGNLKICDNPIPYRSSRPEVFCEKFVLKNLAKFTGKHLCWSLFFNKVAGLMSATLLKRDSNTSEFC